MIANLTLIVGIFLLVMVVSGMSLEPAICAWISGFCIGLSAMYMARREKGTNQ